MATISLPSKNKQASEQQSKQGQESQQAPSEGAAADLNQSMAGVVDSIGEMNKVRREADEQRRVDEAAEKSQRLAAEAEVKVLLDAEPEVVEGKSRRDTVNDMSNTELLDVVSTAVDTAMSARSELSTKAVDEKIGETKETINKIYKALAQMQATSGIKSARERYKDFDIFREDTMAVLKTYPMMDVEHAYLLGKQIRKGGSPDASQTASERPDNIPLGGEGPDASRDDDRSNQPPRGSSTSGIVGFRDIVGKALDKVLKDKTYEGR